jgi:hypothetical protein
VRLDDGAGAAIKDGIGDGTEYGIRKQMTWVDAGTVATGVRALRAPGIYGPKGTTLGSSDDEQP